MVVVALLGCGSSGDGPAAPVGPIRWDLRGPTADVIGALAGAAGTRAGGAASGAGRVDTEVAVAPAEALEVALSGISAAGGAVERGPAGVTVSAAPAEWSARVLAPLAGAEALVGARGADGMAPWGFERTPGGTVYAWCQCSEVPFDAGVAPPSRLGEPAVEVLGLDRAVALVAPPGSDAVQVVAVGGAVDGHRLASVTPEIAWEPAWEVPGTPDHPLLVSPEQRAEITDPARVATLARVIPHRGPAGEVDGYRLSALRRGSSLELLGLRNGDVLLRVADHGLSTREEVAAAQAAIGASPAFCVDLERRGEPLRLCYEVRAGG